jgi:maleylacetate reductase
MKSFAYPEGVYNAMPERIVFGTGALDQVGEEVERLEASRVVVVCTPGRRKSAEDLAARLGQRCVAVLAEAKTQVPIETAEAGTEQVRRLGADGLITIGGGASTGLGKAIALKTGIPLMAIPTTYSGSEMTGFCGITIAGVKRMHADRRMVARTVIYDPALTVGLPPHISGPSGMNALAHCVEALYVATAGPIASLMAEEGARSLKRSLPQVVRDPGDLEARSEALYGAYLAGGALTGGFAIHHGLAHVLGGSFGIEHGLAHSLMLPHSVAFNAPAVPEAMRRLAVALEVENPAAGLFDLAVDLGIPMRLADLGVREGDLDRAAEIAVETAHDNPRRIDFDGMRTVLQAALHGRRPSAKA